MYSSRGMPAGGLNATRALLLVSSQKWLPRRCRAYRREDTLGPNWRAVPIRNSLTVRGVMSGTNSFPDEEPTGTATNSRPLASKWASTNVPVRLRSQEAARGSELAAGLYFA